MGFVMLADLNAIGILASNFFLASYALMNLSCFHSEFTKPPRSDYLVLKCRDCCFSPLAGGQLLSTTISGSACSQPSSVLASCSAWPGYTPPSLSSARQTLLLSFTQFASAQVWTLSKKGVERGELPSFWFFEKLSPERVGGRIWIFKMNHSPRWYWGLISTTDGLLQTGAVLLTATPSSLPSAAPGR